MSFSDAIGQMDQIVQWEQQLSDPAALTQTTSTDATTAGDTTTTSDTGASTSTSFAEALAQAEAADGSAALSSTIPTTAGQSGVVSAAGSTSASTLLDGGDSQLLAALSSLDDGAAATTPASTTTAAATAAAATTAAVTGESGPGGGDAVSASDPRIAAMTEEANALVGKPYVWGGGHDGWGAQSGYDCSGFVSAVLHAGGYLSAPQDTTTLPTSTGIEAGPGRYVTVYDRDQPGQSGHVIIDINGQFYESGGEQGSWGGGGGIEAISTPSDAYLATFDRVLHPAGL